MYKLCCLSDKKDKKDKIVKIKFYYFSRDNLIPLKLELNPIEWNINKNKLNNYKYLLNKLNNDLHYYYNINVLLPIIINIQIITNKNIYSKKWIDIETFFKKLKYNIKSVLYILVMICRKEYFHLLKD